jgi:2-amino-4-hydroxy-6-hydroxymethyldihydropteridine diphosphokinase
MANCLIALGSNLGDRAGHLRRALAELACTPGVQAVARSAWHETAPVGGPDAQSAYLNGAMLASTALGPSDLWRELARIERELGRIRGQRWEARRIDLDILLYEHAQLVAPELAVPHPRMHYRRFVLAPAREVAPWMVHPTSGWTVARLADQLEVGGDEIAVAAADLHLGAALAAGLARFFRLTAGGSPIVAPWAAGGIGNRRPKLVLAVAPGSEEPAARRMLQLPRTGPIAWVTLADQDAMLAEAVAIVASALPELAMVGDQVN